MKIGTLAAACFMTVFGDTVDTTVESASTVRAALLVALAMNGKFVAMTTGSSSNPVQAFESTQYVTRLTEVYP